ncbi:glycosyl transferase family 2 [Roseinatronobacter bogoriensis subsp. barguzinensis]|nr:glycosyl transferase family 2 [Rhodobaca barguzinensis]TDY74445.1 glycosyl transferase family 2 [Rhodobaca bogoriensis DSM 18756]
MPHAETPLVFINEGSTMALPPCDVIIPARNAAATLGEAVSSVLAQTAPDLCLYIVDDGSTDSTQAIAREFAAADSRVTVLSLPGAGISAAMNAGIAAGSNPVIARLDADDISDPDRHARQLAYFVANRDVVALSGAHREIRANGTLTGRIHRAAFETHADPARAPASEPPLTQPFFMVRRTALMAAGGYRPFPVSEDSDLYWRLSEQGALVCLPEIVGSYRVHSGSISAASIVNGRLMALCSQLAALSARRRGRGAADIILPAQPRWRDAGDLASMIDHAAADTGLEPAELRHLRIACAAKLMELAGYRPYELEARDCTFIAYALEMDADGLAPENRSDLAKMRSASAARLLRKGHVGRALKLAPVSLMPQTLLRAGTGRLYWSKLPG